MPCQRLKPIDGATGKLIRSTIKNEGNKLNGRLEKWYNHMFDCLTVLLAEE